MNYTKLAIGRLTALAVVLLIPSACETVSKKEWAITQNQVTRIDERVATIGKTLSLQADLAANIEQLRSSVSVMTGQIEEFNARTQMFSERLAKQEKNLNETLAANRNDIIESYSGLAQETREFRKEIQAMSLEARGSARAIDVRIASVEARLAVMDEAIHNQPSKKTGKAREKEKTVAEPIRPEATPVAQPDQKSE
ncbi:MAG: hypothetical protein HQK85_04855, partial [Nitrospinae bacterium]|nr:hypothetical protein [Nitrospinota bacterium]